MKHRGREWSETAERHFGFLADHGFGPPELGVCDRWATSVAYRSEVAGLTVSLSYEYLRSEVHLIRLVDGDFPPYPIWIGSDPVNWVLLDTVLEARDPDRAQQAAALSGVDEDSVDQQLAFWADALQAAAPDFLRGSLAVIEDAEKILRSRARRHPQELIAWLPDDAPPTVELQARENLASAVDSAINAQVRRYRRRGWRRHATS